MTLVAPLLLAALVLVVPVVLAFLVRRRRNVIRVPSVILWREVGIAVAQNRRIRNLRRLLSLLACAVGVAALVLAAARPTPKGRGETVAFVIDTSASMDAKGPSGTPLARARGFVAAHLAAGGPRDRFVIVAAGATPVRLAGPAAPGPSLDAALAALTAERGATDLDAAVDFAAALVEHEIGSRVVVLTDGGEDSSLGETRREVALRRRVFAEQARDNLGIAAFATRPPADGSEDEREAIVTVASSSLVPRAARLKVTADGHVIANRRVEIAPRGAAAQGEVEILLRVPAAVSKLTAEVAPDDGFADALGADDRATLEGAARSAPRVVLVGGEGEPAETAAFFVEKALAASGVKEIVRAQPSLEGVVLAPGDVVVALGEGPTARVDAPALYIGTKTGALPYEPGRDLPREATHLRSVDGRAALLRGVSLDGMTVERAAAIKPPAGVRALVDLDGGTVMATGGAGRGAFVYLGIDPARSDLVLRVAFPVLIGNAIASLAGAADVIVADTVARSEILLREASPELAELPVEPEAPMPWSRAESPPVLLAVIAAALLALEAWAHRKGWSL